MIISPEEYFQKYLKDKNKKEIFQQIQKIRRKINKLKKVIEEKILQKHIHFKILNHKYLIIGYI